MQYYYTMSNTIYTLAFSQQTTTNQAVSVNANKATSLRYVEKQHPCTRITGTIKSIPVQYTQDAQHLCLVSKQFGKKLRNSFGVSIDQQTIQKSCRINCFISMFGRMEAHQILFYFRKNYVSKCYQIYHLINQVSHTFCIYFIL